MLATYDDDSTTTVLVAAVVLSYTDTTDFAKAVLRIGVADGAIASRIVNAAEDGSLNVVGVTGALSVALPIRSPRAEHGWRRPRHRRGRPRPNPLRRPRPRSRPERLVREVGRWANGRRSVEFVKCISATEVLARIEDAAPSPRSSSIPRRPRPRPVRRCSTGGCALVAVDHGLVERDWRELGVAGVLERFDAGELMALLDRVSSQIDAAHVPARGRRCRLHALGRPDRHRVRYRRNRDLDGRHGDRPIARGRTERRRLPADMALRAVRRCTTSRCRPRPPELGRASARHPGRPRHRHQHLRSARPRHLPRARPSATGRRSRTHSTSWSSTTASTRPSSPTSRTTSRVATPPG